MNIYDYTIKDAKGQDISLADYKGKVLLIVNTATECGFTPQYEGLQAMYDKYHEQGLEIIDIPSNQFLGQAPGTNEEITQFCQLKYNTTFPQMNKSDVNGENQLPLYKFLKEEKGFEGFGNYDESEFLDGFLRKENPEYDKNSDIKWNFTKFVIDREGNVVKRFEPVVDMAEVEALVKELL